MGVRDFFSSSALVRSVSARPPSLVRPATIFPSSRDFDGLVDVDVEEAPWMEGKASGRYHLSNFCSAIWSP